MAAETDIQPVQQPVNPARVFTKAELKQCADLDREVREAGSGFAQAYHRAVAADVWLALKWESLEAWSASVLKGMKLDKLEREQLAAELAEAGKTVREIAAATGVSVGTVAGDLKAGVQKLNTSETGGQAVSAAVADQVPAGQTPRQQAARRREKKKRADAQPSGDGQNGSLGGQNGTSGAGGQAASLGATTPWPVLAAPVPQPCTRCAPRIAELKAERDFWEGQAAILAERLAELSGWGA